MRQVLAADRRLHRLAAAASAAGAAQGERRRREAFVIQSEKGVASYSSLALIRTDYIGYS